MSNNPYNSPLSMAARMIIVLGARPHLPRTERLLAAIDFLATQSEDFGIHRFNLHGHIGYVAAEFGVRVQNTRSGLRYAVIHGLITADSTPAGITYQISEKGMDFRKKLASQYRNEYDLTLNATLAFVDSHNPREVMRRIEQLGITDVQEDTL